MNPQVIEQQQVAKLLPKRPRDSHKGQFGTVVVIGGASGMTGAALLAGRAALKLGAGCVHVVLLTDNAPAVDLLQPELMLHKADFVMPAQAGIQLNKNTGFPLGRKLETSLRSFSQERQVLAVGCGMGHDTTAKQMLHLALQSTATLMLDADALNLIAADTALQTLLIARKKPTVLTPHPGEAARLLACSTTEIQENRIESVQRLAKRFGCCVVLKGADSLCATCDGQLFVNHTGNPGMSGPGMGDVLSGMIAALIAQGLSADDALLLAVHLHGAAGDELAKQTAVGMTATELTDQARRLLNQWLIN